MELNEALAFIHATDWKGSRLGLERMRELMHRLGNPQDSLKFIHVAGTNGKGSTSTMLASLLTAAGYKTGIYTSPHLVRVNERFRICLLYTSSRCNWKFPMRNEQNLYPVSSPPIRWPVSCRMICKAKETQSPASPKRDVYKRQADACARSARAFR